MHVTLDNYSSFITAFTKVGAQRQLYLVYDKTRDEFGTNSFKPSYPRTKEISTLAKECFTLLESNQLSLTDRRQLCLQLSQGILSYTVRFISAVENRSYYFSCCQNLAQARAIQLSFALDTIQLDLLSVSRSLDQETQAPLQKRKRQTAFLDN